MDACAAVRDALLSGELSRSLNVPEGEPGRWPELSRAVLSRGVQRRSGARSSPSQGEDAVSRIEVRGAASLVPARDTLVAAAALGVLDGILEHERLNVINARSLAEARGIELSFTESYSADATTTSHTIEVRLVAGNRDVTIAVRRERCRRTGSGERWLPLTRIGPFRVDVSPRDSLVILTNRDVPGVIGRVGTLLGEAGVNIAEYHQARLAQGGEALAAVSVDGGS